MNKDQLHALLYDALETEKVGVLIYETALSCAINPELAQEWQRYLDQTREHVSILIKVLTTLGLNPDQATLGRAIVRHAGEGLIVTMVLAIKAGTPDAAQIVAAECVVQAETKDHMNWELIGAAADALSGVEQEVLKTAYDEVEDQEDEHLYHTAGWARELHLQALGLPAQLPPAEEEQDVRSESEAAEVKKERKQALTQKTKKKGSTK